MAKMTPQEGNNQFNIRIGNLEIRNDSVGKTDLQMVQWGDKFCWVIAYWQSHDEGADLKFVGNRPFDVRIAPMSFWTLAQIGQKYLEGKLINENSPD